MRKIIEKYIARNKKGTYDIELNPDKIFEVEKFSFLYPDTLNIFGLNFKYTNPINWHYDMYTSKEFPRIFSKDIQIQSDKYGSAKHVWEVNRLLFLPGICLNYINTNDPKYLEQFTSITKNWIRENPYLTGINWYSNIEVNIRLINWFFCWEILKASELINLLPEFKEFVHREWLPAIYLHCHYSYRNPSKYSSANNHIISEYSGLFVASSLWKFREAKMWNSYAKKGLEEEIVKQHSQNGINKEEAAEYIQFITDFLLIAYVIGEYTVNNFSQRYKNCLKNIFNYIYNFTDIEVNFPRYGDEDDGRVILLDPYQKNNFSSLLTSAAIIFKDPVFKSRSSGFDIKNSILFGSIGKRIFQSLENTKPPRHSCFYENEGHFILRHQRESNEIFIHFDAAPLGYLSIAAHGHADALSFIIHKNGKEVLVDSGTYTYHTDPDLRQYFIGTLAHNTIRINKKNQALNGGPTLWLKHYKTHLIHSTSNKKYDEITASHNGYNNLGVVHTREFVFDKYNNKVIITDTINIKKKADFLIEFPLHIHPTMYPVYKSHYYTIYDACETPTIGISVDPKFKSRILSGSLSPFIGWYSESFSKIQPTSVIYQTTNIHDSATFVTTIEFC